MNNLYYTLREKLAPGHENWPYGRELSWPLWAPGIYVVHRHTCRQNSCEHNIKQNNKIQNKGHLMARHTVSTKFPRTDPMSPAPVDGSRQLLSYQLLSERAGSCGGQSDYI